MVRREPWFLVHHGIPAREHRRFVVTGFVIVHAGLFVQFLGVEGVFGDYVTAEVGVVLSCYLTKGCVEEALGDVLVLVGNKGGAAEVVGVVVEVFPFISFLFSSPGKKERNEAKTVCPK